MWHRVWYILILSEQEYSLVSKSTSWIPHWGETVNTTLGQNWTHACFKKRGQSAKLLQSVLVTWFFGSAWKSALWFGCGNKVFYHFS